MEALSAAGRHSVGLPSINHLGPAESVKREEMEYQRKQAAPAMVSPLHPFPGPSHSYGHHQSGPASSLPPSLGGLLSPPTSRRTSDDEKDQHQRPPPARQSLPSIHEALGKEPPALPYPPPPSAPPSASQSYFPPSSAASAEQRTRTFSVDHINNPVPPNLFTQPPRSPFKPAATAPPPPTTHAQPEILARSSYAPSSHASKLPALHPLRTTESPAPPARPNPPYSSYPPPPPSVHEAPAPQSAGPMNPQYGYPPYQPNYPLSAPAPSAPHSGYPPSAAPYSASSRYPPPTWRNDNSEFARPEEKPGKGSSLAPYGALVKRHLESFDLEASLNEISEGAGRVAEFSKTYRERAHNNQRAGITPHSIPTVVEVDEMLKQGEKISFSLRRMRDVVVNHQQASLVEQSHDAQYRQANGFEDGQAAFNEDSKGGVSFGGIDQNKRTKRGQRAAPPGRCHSCSRVETPEWRRGPDGARTLCNACGLHYAKMSRRMVAGGKQPTNSQAGWQRTENLRPKSLGGGSPAA